MSAMLLKLYLRAAAGLAVWVAVCVATPSHAATSAPADLIVTRAVIATMDAAKPRASALAVRDGKFILVGNEAEIEKLRGPETVSVDARGHTLIPGLNDSHLHAVREGRFYNLELRWDGVESLERALTMVKEQASRTPKGQWVRVIGGWSPYQFNERRMPTIAELNAAAPDTPTFVLFLYSQGFLNRAAVQALGLTSDAPAPDGGRYEFVDGGAILHAEPNPLILYQMIAKPPPLSTSDQVNSTLQFYRELNRLGLTSAVDAGGGGHAFPEDYASSDSVAQAGDLPLRISYYLFPQIPGKEADDFRRWMAMRSAGSNTLASLEHGFELEGGGEFLAHSAGDWENFMAARPDLDDRKRAGQDPDGDLKQVVALLVQKQWPLRLHATYGETIVHIMDVFESVAREQGRFVPRFAIDHAETVQDSELQRVKSMGGGFAIQDRMAYAGEFFAERYGAATARYAPPIRRMLDLGIPVAAGTDGTRVSSYNPWPSLYWLVTGKTVGGTQLFADDNRLSREEALRLFTVGSAWMSQEETVKGRIAPDQYADFAVLSEDYFSVAPEQIKNIESLLTVVAGKVVYAAGPFNAIPQPSIPPVSPGWSPVAHYGGYQKSLDEAPH
jgi:predicted amidohydrolase YtcJ